MATDIEKLGTQAHTPSDVRGSRHRFKSMEGALVFVNDYFASGLGTYVIPTWEG